MLQMAYNSAMTRRRTPLNLQAAGKKLWLGVTGHYTLDPAETALLEQLCRCLDLLDRLNADLAEMGVVVAGSERQPRPNPLIKSVVEVAKLADQLTRSLALPVGNEVQGQRRGPSAKARVRSGRPKKSKLGRVSHLIKQVEEGA